MIQIKTCPMSNSETESGTYDSAVKSSTNINVNNLTKKTLKVSNQTESQYLKTARSSVDPERVQSTKKAPLPQNLGIMSKTCLPPRKDN